MGAHAAAVLSDVDLRIDRVDVHDGAITEISVAGWCWSATQSIADLTLAADGLEMPCLYLRERPDLAVQIDPRASHAGFACRIPFPKHSRALHMTAKVAGKSRVLARIAAPSPNRPHPAVGMVRTYSDWLVVHEPRLFWPRDQARERVRSLRSAPTISIVVPTYNTPLYYLHRCIRSVLNQDYPHWQLCIADDGSCDPDAIEALKQFAALDDRIVLKLRERSGGTSAASNTALESATGDYVALLDHDDEVHPSALMEIVRCINTSPGVDLIYSDEDKIDDEGRRFYPTFKPAFDPAMILAFNYIGHLVCIRRAVLEQVHGFRTDCDGSQDWDLLLRVIERVGPRAVRHVPKPLYHWRYHAHSTAMSLDAKPHVFAAWQRVLGDHIARTGKSGEAAPGLFRGSMQIRPHRGARASIAVVYCSRDAVAQRRAIQRTGSSSVRLYELLLSRLCPAETPSPGAPLLTLSEIPCEVIVLLNAPVETLNHGFFEALAAQAMQEDCGLAGPLILTPEGTVRSAGLMCRIDGTVMNPFADLPHAAAAYMGLAKVPRTVASIGPQCFAIRKSLLQTKGGLAILAEDALTKLCGNLVQLAHKEHLHVMYTPYAVMTIQLDFDSGSLPDIATAPAELRINPNIEAFQSPVDFLKGGYVD